MMMSAGTAGMLVRTVMSVLGCFMVALLVYTIAIDGLPFRMELLTRWMAALLIDFYINIAVIGSWVVTCLQGIKLDHGSRLGGFVNRFWKVIFFFRYLATCLIISLLIHQRSEFCYGATFFASFYSVTTCGYIVLQFFKLTPEESSKDPLYFVLARHQKTDAAEHRKGLSVVYSVLGCLMLGTLLYTLIVDGSPFRAELYTPCG